MNLQQIFATLVIIQVGSIMGWMIYSMSCHLNRERDCECITDPVDNRNS